MKTVHVVATWTTEHDIDLADEVADDPGKREEAIWEVARNESFDHNLVDCEVL